MPLLIALIDGTVDLALIIAIAGAAMTALGVIAFLGAIGFTAKALSDMVKALCGVKDKVMRRTYKNHDGREVIEEIPYEPAMNIVNVATRAVKEITDGRNQH
jgi:hypothetical protein